MENDVVKITEDNSLLADTESFNDILAEWGLYYGDDFVEQEKITLREHLTALMPGESF
jgi:hypothetical protein